MLIVYSCGATGQKRHINRNLWIDYFRIRQNHISANMYPWMDSFWGFPSTDQFRNSNLTDPITSYCCRISRSVTYVAHLSAMCKNAFTAILLCYLTCFYTPLTFILQPHFELMDVVSYEWRWRRRGRFIYQLSLTYATRSVGPGRWPGKHQQ